MLSVKQGSIKYHFKVFGMTRFGLETRFPGPLSNTLPTRPMTIQTTTFMIGLNIKKNQGDRKRLAVTKNVNETPSGNAGMKNSLIIIIKVIIVEKLTNVIERNPKAPFSIATTPRCRGGRYFFPWIAPLYPWYVPVCWVLSKAVSSTIFLSLWYESTWDWNQVSRAIGKHSTHKANEPNNNEYFCTYFLFLIWRK